MSEFEKKSGCHLHDAQFETKPLGADYKTFTHCLSSIMASELLISLCNFCLASTREADADTHP
jgi:hypothetical protein